VFFENRLLKIGKSRALALVGLFFLAAALNFLVVLCGPLYGRYNKIQMGMTKAEVQSVVDLPPVATYTRVQASPYVTFLDCGVWGGEAYLIEVEFGPDKRAVSKRLITTEPNIVDRILDLVKLKLHRGNWIVRSERRSVPKVTHTNTSGSLFALPERGHCGIFTLLLDDWYSVCWAADPLVGVAVGRNCL
jgi:hypothetical protein